MKNSKLISCYEGKLMNKSACTCWAFCTRTCRGKKKSASRVMNARNGKSPRRVFSTVALIRSRKRLAICKTTSFSQCFSFHNAFGLVQLRIFIGDFVIYIIFTSYSLFLFYLFVLIVKRGKIWALSYLRLMVPPSPEKCAVREAPIWTPFEIGTQNFFYKEIYHGHFWYQNLGVQGDPKKIYLWGVKILDFEILEKMVSLWKLVTFEPIKLGICNLISVKLWSSSFITPKIKILWSL